MREINIENTIYINNLLADYQNNGYIGYSDCMVAPEAIDRMIIDQYSVTIEYQVPYEDWIDTWVVPKKYFYMSDDEILADAKAKYLAEEARQEKQELLQLERMAERLGYKLVKLESVKLEE
jgi:hypothetical protein